MSATVKNVSIALPVELMDRVRCFAREKANVSINNIVREALEKYLAEKRREEFRQDMLEASQDPLFLADAEKCMRDFENIDRESWESVPEW